MAILIFIINFFSQTLKKFYSAPHKKDLRKWSFFLRCRPPKNSGGAPEKFDWSTRRNFLSPHSKLLSEDFPQWSAFGDVIFRSLVDVSYNIHTPLPFFSPQKCSFHRRLHRFLWVCLSLFVSSFSSAFSPRKRQHRRLLHLLSESAFLYTRMYPSVLCLHMMSINCPCSLARESRGWRLPPLPIIMALDACAISTECSNKTDLWGSV